MKMVPGLQEHGSQQSETQKRIKQHPDTHIVFSEFTIPYYKEAVDICLKAHKFFYNIRSIGWDIAITEDGTVFLEGNDNWEMQTFQAIYGGQKKKWYEICE